VLRQTNAAEGEDCIQEEDYIQKEDFEESFLKGAI
jgi:hypothetical protein